MNIMNLEIDNNVKSCVGDILLLKRKVLEKKHQTLYEDVFKSLLANKLNELYGKLHDFNVIDDDFNCRYTGIGEVDYFLSGLEKTISLTEKEFDTSYPSAESFLDWLYNNNIPQFVEILEPNLTVTKKILRTTDDFEKQFHLILMSGHENALELAGELLIVYGRFAEKNGLLSPPNASINPFAYSYIQALRSIRESGYEDKFFNALPNYLGILEDDSCKLNSVTALTKYFIKNRALHNIDQSDFRGQTVTYFVDQLLEAETVYEIQLIVSDIFMFFFKMDWISEEKYGPFDIYEYFLTYTSFDYLAFVLIESNLFGHLAICKEGCNSITSIVRDDIMDEEQKSNFFDFDDFKFQLKETFKSV